MWTYIPFALALMGAFAGYESYQTFLYNGVSVTTGFIIGGLIGEGLRKKFAAKD